MSGSKRSKQSDTNLANGSKENDKKAFDIWNPQVPVEQSHYYNDEDTIPFFPSNPIKNDSRPTILDLFCGAGGISVGFEMAGFRTVLGVDIHEPSLASFRTNHPHGAAVLGDISKVDSAQVHSLIGDQSITVISAGVPCQGFSISNRKRWQNDKRNFLFREFIRFIDMLQPDAILLENVGGMVSTKGGQFVEDISTAMSEAGQGYHVESRLLNAADYGTPQIRKRLMFLGHRTNTNPNFLFTWPEPTHYDKQEGELEIWEQKYGYVTVGQAFEDLPRLDRGQSSSAYAQPSSQASDFAQLMRKGNKVLTCHEASMGTAQTSKRIANTPQGQPLYKKFRQRIRLHWERPSPTVVSGGIRPQFQNGHPLDARGLTIRERARLMSFPDNFVFEGGTVMGRVQTGQAVPPLLAKAVAEEIKNILPDLHANP